jgi:hypothetical protein
MAHKTRPPRSPTRLAPDDRAISRDTMSVGRTASGFRRLSPASCKGPGLRQIYGTTCEGGGVGGVMLAEWPPAVKRKVVEALRW